PRAHRRRDASDPSGPSRPQRPAPRRGGHRVDSCTPEYNKCCSLVGMTTLHIVGGGIAGLTLAATLRRPDWQVVVHEQDRPAHESEVGTAFGMWPAALRALDEIGLGDAVRERGTRCDRGHLRTADDRTIARMSGQKVVMIGRIALQEL